MESNAFETMNTINNDYSSCIDETNTRYDDNSEAICNDGLIKYTYHVSDFDYCRLSEKRNKVYSECLICRKERNKKVKTSLKCSTCDIHCCTECYDCHRREQLVSTLRKFQKKNVVNINLSRCGEFLEARIKALNEKFSVEKPSEIILENNKRTIATKTNLQTVSLISDPEYPHVSDSLSTLTFSSVKPAISLLKERYGGVSELMFDGEGKFKCMYFQDGHMKDFFNFYPHRICIDVTCAIPALNVVLYLFLSEDSNGQSEIISVSLISVEDMESLTWLLTMLKKHNPCWREIKMLIVDSLIKNREIIKSCFPDTHIMTCFYHSTRTFKRDLDSKDFCDLSDEQRINITSHFEKMVLACSEMEYSLLYQQLFSINYYVYDYFERTWHATRHEWRMRMEYCDNIFHAINAFLSFIENVLKPVLSAQVNLCEFIQKFFFILKLLRMERSSKIPFLFKSSQLSLYSKFTPQYHISKVLTPYAADLVIHQLDVSAEISINPGVVLDSYIFCRFGTTAVANSSTCTCKFFLLTSLFCCHIFAVRRVLSLPVFDESLCTFYWTQKYFQDVHVSLQESSSQEDQNECYSPVIVDKLLPILLGGISAMFEQRFFLLNQLVLAWKKNEEVFLQFDGVETTELQDIRTTPSENFERLSSHSDLNVKEEEVEHALCNVSCYLDLQTDTPNETQKTAKPSFLCTDWKFGSNLLEGLHVNFVYLSQVICKTKESCIEWLQYMDFLPNSMNCPACGCDMKHESAARLSDGVIWICTTAKKNKKCAKRCTVRRGTWFEGTNMSLEQILFFTYMWINTYPSQQIVFELGISAATFTVWDKFFRRVCWFFLQENIGSLDRERLDLNGKTVLYEYLQSKNEQDVFIGFLKDTSLLHEKENGYSLQRV